VSAKCLSMFHMPQWLNILFTFPSEIYSVFLTPNAGISRFDFSNSYIWFEFYNAPLAKDVSLICDVSKSILLLYFVVHSPRCTLLGNFCWISFFVGYSSMAHCRTSWRMQRHEHASKLFFSSAMEIGNQIFFLSLIFP
jgi:hypothetical protein